MHLSVATIAFLVIHLVAGQTSLLSVPSSTALASSYDEDGTPKSLPRGNSTAVATVQRTKTSTTVAFTTVVETLTFLDLGRRTQTNTHTVTSVTGSNQNPTKASSAPRDLNRGLFRRIPRMHPAISFAPVSSPERAEGYAVSGLRFVPRQAVFTVTTTKTIEITTTVTQTVTHTIFTTITSAPSATYTTSTATTIYVPPGAGVTTSAAQPTGGQNVPTGSGGRGQITQTGTRTPGTTPSSFTAESSNIESSGIRQSSQSDMPSSSALGTTSTNIETTTTPPESGTPSTGVATPSTLLSSSSDTIRGTPGTMLTATPTSSNPTAPPAAPPSALSNEQIVGVIIGSFAFLVFLGIIAFMIRHAVQRHRSRLAQRRQQVTPPSGQAAAAGSGSGSGSGGGSGTALHSNSTAASSGRDPANDVRIVIQQAPAARRQFSHLWPLPPGHAGPGYTTTHVESSAGATTTTTTGEGMTPVPAPLSLHHHQYQQQQQQPPQDPGQWSNASEFGSSASPDGSRAGGEARYSGAPSSGVFGRGLFSPGQASSAAASPSRPPQAHNNGKKGGGGLFRSSGGSGWL